MMYWHYISERTCILKVANHVEVLDCSKCTQLTQDSFLTLSRPPIIVLNRLRCLLVPTELTLPDAVYESLANAGCLPQVEQIENIQSGSSVCNPLRCQVSKELPRISMNELRNIQIKLKNKSSVLSQSSPIHSSDHALLISSHFVFFISFNGVPQAALTSPPAVFRQRWRSRQILYSQQAQLSTGSWQQRQQCCHLPGTD